MTLCVKILCVLLKIELVKDVIKVCQQWNLLDVLSCVDIVIESYVKKDIIKKIQMQDIDHLI